ncbi:MAG: hypothetical protein ACPGVU_03550 [Limisphaerales bacterium]
MSAELISAAKGLLDEAGLADLGPGPRAGRQTLAALNRSLDALFEQHGRPRKAELIRSLILLWHDHLEPSHEISQDEHNPDGSLVHAIMHRREPDYSNAKYWWRSTGDHECFPAIARKVEGLVANDPDLAEQTLSDGEWDSYGFTDAVDSGIREAEDTPRHQLLKQIQRAETDTVLEYLAG